jgi:hypothetical protein
MAYVTINEVNAWLEPSKLSVTTIETELETQVVNLILGQLSGSFDTSGWTSNTNTPKLIRTIISMHYAAWLTDRAFSDSSDELNSYATLLREMANANIAGLLSGTLTYEDIPPLSGEGDITSPAFFPNDQSSANPPTEDTPHDGPAAFMMGQVF